VAERGASPGSRGGGRSKKTPGERGRKSKNKTSIEICPMAKVIRGTDERRSYSGVRVVKYEGDEWKNGGRDFVGQ